MNLQFSEEIDIQSATEISNYSIADISFLGASLLSDNRSVNLIMDTDHLSMNVMGVFNIQDDSQNTMVSEVVWIDIPEHLGDTIKINTGGDMSSGYYADQIWGPDKEYGFIAGNFQNINNNVDIHNTDNDVVYRSSLNRVASYKIRLKPGAYTIKMLFSENHYSSPNDRIFDGQQ